MGRRKTNTQKIFTVYKWVWTTEVKKEEEGNKYFDKKSGWMGLF